MKKHTILLVILLVIIFPQLIFSLFADKNIEFNSFDAEENEQVSQVGKAQTILVKNDDSVKQMELDDYVTGVVLGEMPADFELEALKAQAVATRTYTLRRVMRNGKHSDADVCTDAACCQAYVQISDYSGGKEKLDRVKLAVSETNGLVLTYEGNLIEATYFSTSGGRTEDAVAVWGASVPYLRSVDSPGEEKSKHFENSVTISFGEFLKRLDLPESYILSDDSIVFTYTDGGGVDTMQLAGKTFSGVQLRRLLELSSTVFTIDIQDDCLLITTRGNGHRVGMSQYGAEAMAVEGYTYDQILMHYYSGATLEKLTEEQINTIFDKEENL